MAFAKGKYAKAISDRSGMEFPYNEMVREWNGSFVHKSEYEARHPQDEPRHYGAEGHGLRNARPARAENEVSRMLGPNPFETVAASSLVNVTGLDLSIVTGNTFLTPWANVVTGASNTWTEVNAA